MLALFSTKFIFAVKTCMGSYHKSIRTCLKFTKTVLGKSNKFSLLRFFLSLIIHEIVN